MEPGKSFGHGGQRKSLKSSAWSWRAEQNKQNFWFAFFIRLRGLRQA
jgi:hypothetical protein